MMRRRTSIGIAAVVLGMAFAAASVGACSDDGRGEFHEPATEFGNDASTEDAPDCRLRCSLDGRSVIEGCTGKVVETCRDDEACSAGECMDPCAAAAADRSSNGCEFYFQMPRFTKRWPRNCLATFVVNTSTKPATMSLELEGNSLDLSKSVYKTNPGSTELIPHHGEIAPGESVLVFVAERGPNDPPEAEWESPHVPCPAEVTAASYLDRVPDGTGLGSSFHLVTDVPVATTMIYPFGGAATWLPTATLVLPVSTWATEHMMINGWEASECGSPAAQIVASEDDTELTLLPRTDLQDGNGVRGTRANTRFTFHLDKGQFLQIVQPSELTGSVLTSNKPTSVFGGHSCANIPVDKGTADALLQQIPPYQQWGSEYVGVGYRPRLGNEHEPMMYRLVAARDGTRLEYDPAIPPGAPITMSAGEVATFQSGTGDAFVVRTQDVDHPIYLAAYMTGHQGYQSFGDPEFVNVVPAGQYLNSYSFYADTTYVETSLVVVRAKTGGEFGEFKDVWLECAGNLTGWKPVGKGGQYEWVRVDLQRHNGPGETFGTSVCQVGLQRMKSDGPFTATLWGWANYASYAYPGGMAQRKLVDLPLTVH